MHLRVRATLAASMAESESTHKLLSASLSNHIPSSTNLVWTNKVGVSGALGHTSTFQRETIAPILSII